MENFSVTHTNTLEGWWNGIVTRSDSAPAVPDIVVLHLDKPLDGIELAVQGDGSWALRFPIPADILNDGVQTLLITDARTGVTLDSYSIVTGQALENDFRAELDLLRAEVDMLKKAFRRHCLETA